MNKCEKYAIVAVIALCAMAGYTLAAPADQNDLENFFKFYYLKPEPDRASPMMHQFLESEIFTGGSCDEHCQNVTCYFFARIAQRKPVLVEDYKVLFENGTHDQRLFLLRVFRLCGDEKLRKFFITRLRAGRYAREKKQIEEILAGPIPVKFDPVREAVDSPEDLDYLWAEFLVTGDEKAVRKIIFVLSRLKDGRGKQIAVGGAARWSLKSNGIKHRKVLELCKAELSKAKGSLKEVLQEVVTAIEKSDDSPQHLEANKEMLESRAKELMSRDDVSLRKDVDDLFRLADIYADDTKTKKAIALYERALRADSWRLEYQLKLAQLLKGRDRAHAVEKATLVYDYAEDERLIRDAEHLLVDLGEDVPKASAGNPDLAADMEIVIVPMGAVNGRLVREVSIQLQEIMGVKYTIWHNCIDVGETDRNNADRHLTRIVELVKSDMGKEYIKAILVDLNLKEADLEGYDAKIRFVDTCLRQMRMPEERIEALHQQLEEGKKVGQYDASRLDSLLQEQFRIQENSHVSGYLGITEKDIYCKDYNFVFGWAGKGYGVMSYHRFRADFNDETPNRQRLRKRAVKQAISSSFFVLRIKRCTTPTCARAYPHDLTEHDQKGIELCSWCRGQLANLTGGHN